MRSTIFLFIGAIVLSASLAFAEDSPFYFDESGQVQSRGYWSPNARTKSDFETDRRMYNDHMNREALKQNEALIDEYHSRKPVAPPSGSGSFWVTPGAGELSRLCTQIAPGQIVCQ
ncbi:MAG: hypothetical protein NDI90_15470 [Nitrospira sp. BO4]|jgi:hypothetical protein|nr:hypothetical protein [Nitrospira sp. BO4]